MPMKYYYNLEAEEYTFWVYSIVKIYIVYNLTNLLNFDLCTPFNLINFYYEFITT